MGCDSVHSLNAAMRRLMFIYQASIPTKAARKYLMLYHSRLLDHTFFKDFSKGMVYKSIRPGHCPGDPTVNELRWIQYEPTGLIYYKVNFEDDLQEIPTRPKQITEFSSFPTLYQSRPKIPRDKLTGLQYLKVFTPGDTHALYNNLQNKEETLKRQLTINKRNVNTEKKSEIPPSPHKKQTNRLKDIKTDFIIETAFNIKIVFFNCILLCYYSFKKSLKEFFFFFTMHIAIL